LNEFLPHEYAKLAQIQLKEYFPDKFEIDLNGRTLPWEAAILIPFVKEDLFLELEQGLFKDGMVLSQEEWTRNTVSFSYPSYTFAIQTKQ